MITLLELVVYIERQFHIKIMGGIVYRKSKLWNFMGAGTHPSPHSTLFPFLLHFPFYFLTFQYLSHLTTPIFPYYTFLYLSLPFHTFLYLSIPIYTSHTPLYLISILSIQNPTYLTSFSITLIYSQLQIHSLLPDYTILTHLITSLK